MHARFVLPAALTASLMFGAAAAGCPANPCEIVTAGLATTLGGVESALALTAKQKPLYAQWQSVFLAAACSNAKTPEEMSLMERIAWEQQKHMNRADALKKEMPALTALRDSLTDTQRAHFDAAVLEMRFPKPKFGFVAAHVMPENPAFSTLSGTVTTMYSSD